jgi:methanogenic corrinoid protein MtbC1
LNKKEGINMAEIKSTMDIIMEKLKRIEISEEDKKRLLKEDAEQTAKKLMVEYIERGNLNSIIEQLNRLKEEKREETKRALIKESISEIRPYGDKNRKLLELISKLLKTDVSQLEEMLSSAEKKLDQIKERCREDMLNRLKKREIYGSAVIPNVEADSNWRQILEEVSSKLRSDMNNFISQL